MIAGVIGAVLAAFAIYLTDAPAFLGAHPTWAATVIGIGAPLGVFGFIALVRTNRHILLGLSIVGLIVAYMAVVYGKSRFAASFGDDVLAGKMWYFGWIAICGFAPLSMAALVNWIFANRQA